MTVTREMIIEELVKSLFKLTDREAAHVSGIITGINISKEINKVGVKNAKECTM